MTTKPEGLLAEEDVIVEGITDSSQYTSKLSKPLIVHGTAANTSGGTTAIVPSLSGRTITFNTNDMVGGTAYVTIRGRR